MSTIISAKQIVLVGLESVGKSALFRALTGQSSGDETNFPGSTVGGRTAKLLGQRAHLVDTPGIRRVGDSQAAQLTRHKIRQADTILLVVRGTHAQQELQMLLSKVGDDLQTRKTMVVITFQDRASSKLQRLVKAYQAQLGTPVALVNAREVDEEQRRKLLADIEQAQPLSTGQALSLVPALPVVKPRQTYFEHPQLGPWLALLTMALLFALPVYLAYRFAIWLQPVVDQAVINPVVGWLAPLQPVWPFLFALLAGDYGLITLGWYSFLWAFPVVVLIGLSVAVSDEMGLKDRITATLDPWLRHLGLDGRDLIPVLSGFGCNVVAVYQSRACRHCTRQACVSMIAFGSACSYQIGATLSLFNSAQQPWLFGPYLLTVFVVGAIHTRVWHQALPPAVPVQLADRAFLQTPSWRGCWWRLKDVLQKFLLEAMPIFLLICGIGAVLDFSGVLTALANWIAPVLGWFGLPGTVSPGVIFSIVRKDGLLVLNQGEGALLATLSPSQIFILVYLASTFTACLVTLWSIGRELGWPQAGLLAGRQSLTAIISTLVLALLFD